MESRVRSRRELGHEIALLGCDDRDTAFVRRVGGRDEEHLVEAEHVAHVLSEHEMTRMNRVERAAHQADAAAIL